jgi:hypothetical protein
VTPASWFERLPNDSEKQREGGVSHAREPSLSADEDAELERLRAENAALRAQARQRWRTVVAALLIMVACVLAPRGGPFIDLLDQADDSQAPRWPNSHPTADAATPLSAARPQGLLPGWRPEVSTITVSSICAIEPRRKKFLYNLKASLRAAASGGRPRPATPR